MSFTRARIKILDEYPEYIIYSDGRIFSSITDKFVSQRILPSGYSQVRLRNFEGRFKMELVHRLIARAFIPNPYNLPEINHIDECPSNNEVGNLEWCDRLYNLKYNNGIKRRSVKRMETEYSWKIPIIQYTKDGNFVKRWRSATEAARELGFSQSNISACASNRRQTAHGYIWRREN